MLVISRLLVVCVMHMYVAKDERQKFDSKARKCIMLRFGTEIKAYQLYDIEHDRVFFSCDVVVNEANIGFEHESVSKDSNTEYVQLECSVEQYNSESSHEEEEKESSQIE